MKDEPLGPVFVGLYWHHRRPSNRLGLLLIVLGLLGVPYILESSTDPTLFSIGVLTEFPLFLMITIVILAFPSGRLEGLPERLVVAFLVGQLALVAALFAFPPHVPGFTISNCRLVCPGDAPTTSAYSPGSWLIRHHVLAALPVVVSLATVGVIAWRFATGTAPRRRALAIGPDRAAVLPRGSDVPGPVRICAQRPAAERAPDPGRVAVGGRRNSLVRLVRISVRAHRRQIVRRPGVA